MIGVLGQLGEMYLFQRLLFDSICQNLHLMKLIMTTILSVLGRTLFFDSKPWHTFLKSLEALIVPFNFAKV